ncbi:alpha/beta hydrolase [Cryptosporangium arvum]|uniref:Esterase/lipase n=1 Tax=Cryptosporangium arvum DSM 44712 TaxID=927661 RepID=A0A010YFV0_9ACTN|nr:alpha/beta hydrolase fold domain-containing protein [Cryptosporangium arvum]EXG79105.1 esterase/lipase [Cryptosporangium arvum DSM 44712]
MTDVNRQLWQERATGDVSRPWESLSTEPSGLREELWLRPAGADDDRVLLAIHGGGFVSGSIATHRRMFGHLALAAGISTLVVEYGLVPDHVYPAQLDQVSEAYRRLAGRRVALVGDSCGATLALGVAQRGPAPTAMVLFSPWVDLAITGASYDTPTDPFFTRELCRGLASAYLAGASPEPLDVSRLPPTYVQVGGDEALLDDARLLARSSPDVELDEFPGQLHTFQMAVGSSPVADEAIARAGKWLRERL